MKHTNKNTHLSLLIFIARPFTFQKYRFFSFRHSNYTLHKRVEFTLYSLIIERHLFHFIIFYSLFVWYKRNHGIAPNDSIGWQIIRRTGSRWSLSTHHRLLILKKRVLIDLGWCDSRHGGFNIEVGIALDAWQLREWIFLPTMNTN